MGYTHYWYRKIELPQKDFNAFREDVQRLLTCLPQHSISAGGYYKAYPLTIKGPMGTGDPIINEDMIALNGNENDETTQEIEGEHYYAEDLSHETFEITRVFEPGSWQKPDEHDRYFACCKTARKPYDLVVCVSLLLFQYHFPNAHIASDGNAQDWSSAVMLYRLLFPYDVPPGLWSEES